MQQKKDVKSSEKFDFSEKYIKWFSELGKEDIKIAGGKGANLGEMINNDFPVPAGFVVTAKAFEFFVKDVKEKIKNIILGIDFEKTAELREKSVEIRKLIESQEIPEELEKEILEAYQILGSEKINEEKVSEDALNILKNSQEPIFVSVRSSATTEDLADASFAGQQESFLNVKGSNNLIQYVKRCFSSLYTSRALFYRNKKGFSEEEALLAVVVQKMIDSEKSGVIFSKNPLNLDDEIVIEAVFGLGEGIVSGKIHPDNYVVKDLKIKNIKVTDKKIAVVRKGSGENQIVKLSPEKSKEQVLTRGEVLELANYAVKLEEHYQKPQDIEFGLEAGKIYILQSRPITTKKSEKKQGDLSGNIILEGLGASPGIGVGNVKIIKDMNDLSKIKKGDVLVTKMTNPDMVVSMQKSVAIVTDEGGMTAHASIVSREMGIPAVVGTKNATTILKEEAKITVDGSNGKIYEGQVAETKTAEVKPVVETKIKLKLILDLPDFAERSAKSELDSIGLLRLEGIISSFGKHPLFYEKQNNLQEYTELLKKGIQKISENFKSIWIRSSDLRSDEYGSLKGAFEEEINPMLGFHGIRFSLKHPKIFEAELEAIKQIAEANPEKEFGVMFPQVISIEELKKAKEISDKFKAPNIKIGVMIETPASVQIIDDICPEVDFISFGTNDLTQYTLAVDRGEDRVQELYNEIHPAIFSQIKKVLEACKRHKVNSSICGQAGSKKEMAEFLIKEGIDSISVNADAAYDISVFIKELEDKNGFEKKEETFDKRKQEGMIKKEELKEFKKEEKLPEVVNEAKPFAERKRKKKTNAVCAECGKECWVPFRPRPGKSVYCKKCYKSSRGKNKFNEEKLKLPEIPKIEKDTSPVDISDSEKKQEKIQELKEQTAEFPEMVKKPEPDYQKHIGPVSPIDNRDRIEGKAEEIKQDVEEDKLEQIQEDRKVEESIETEGVSSEPVNPEEIGVYNPDEESDNTPQKMKYRFDDGDEDVYSDVF